MSVYRVLAEPDSTFDWWPTPANECFYCGEPLVAGDLAIVWHPLGAGFAYWHPVCGRDWAPKFMRDVWEGMWATSHPSPGPDLYGVDSDTGAVPPRSSRPSPPAQS